MRYSQGLASPPPALRTRTVRALSRTSVGPSVGRPSVFGGVSVSLVVVVPTAKRPPPSLSGYLFAPLPSGPRFAFPSYTHTWTDSTATITSDRFITSRSSSRPSQLGAEHFHDAHAPYALHPSHALLSITRLFGAAKYCTADARIQSDSRAALGMPASLLSPVLPTVLTAVLSFVP